MKVLDHNRLTTNSLTVSMTVAPTTEFIIGWYIQQYLEKLRAQEKK